MTWELADTISAYFWMTIAMWIHASTPLELLALLIIGDGAVFALQWFAQ